MPHVMRPDLHRLAKALRLVGAVLGQREATYLFDGRFAFALQAGWSLVISPDDAQRWRVDACLNGTSRATMWSLVDDRERLVALVASMRDEAAALVA
jgi:hypothetical protein